MLLLLVIPAPSVNSSNDWVSDINCKLQYIKAHLRFKKLIQEIFSEVNYSHSKKWWLMNLDKHSLKNSICLLLNKEISDSSVLY